MLHRRWVWLVVAPAVVAGVMCVLDSRAAAAAGQTDWKINKDDKVVTVFDTPLREEARVLTTISAGVELTVLDIQGDFVSVSTTVSGETKKGWVYAKHLRTPAQLKKLTALSDDYKDYQLWKQALPSLPEAVAFRRIGRPAPLGDLSVSTAGVVSLQAQSDPSEDRKDRAASSLESYVRDSMLERGRRKFDSGSQWLIVVAPERLDIEVVAGSRIRATLVGNLFLVNTSSKYLVLCKQISGEGVTEEEMFREFAKQAAAEYGEILLRWGAEPKVETKVETRVIIERRPPEGPPGPPPGRPPFGPRP